jgi:phospholipid N-methyltransferase
MRNYAFLAIFFSLGSNGEPVNKNNQNESSPLIPKVQVPETPLSTVFILNQLREKNPEIIGAIAESSSGLAKSITKLVPDDSKKYLSAKKVLEIGAGTGIFTRYLVPKLGINDHLDVVELTEELCKVLQDEFGKNKQVTIYCGDILNWNPKYKYDYIVSGLPFNAFPEQLVKAITNHMVRLSKPGTKISFFEYKWLPQLRLTFQGGEEGAQYKSTRKAIESFVNKYKVDEDTILLNIPPATVFHLEIRP